MTGPCFILLCLLTAGRPAAASSLDARLSTVEGATLDVRIVSIQSGVLRYRSSDRDGQCSLADLERIALVAAPAPPHPSTDRPVCIFHLADGGLLEGPILPPRDATDKSVRVDIGLEQPLSLRLDALAAVQFDRSDDTASKAEFESRRKQRATGRDLLIVPQGAKAIVLPGALERLDPHQWAFRFGDKLQTSSFDKAYGVVLGGVTVVDSDRNAMLHSAGRNQFTAKLLSADATALHVDAGPLGELTIPWQFLTAISLRSRRVVYLSDLEPATTTQRSLFDVRWPPRRDSNVTGGPLVVNGHRYPKGLGVHAYTALTYKLDGGFERLSAMIGLDDSAADGGSALFRVRGDDRTLYESDLITAREDRNVSLDVKDVRELTLECDGGPDLDLADHCDWADVRLIRASPEITR